MPKKPPRNAFYYFMQQFKEEQSKKGITYANMAEVADAAGPIWTNATPNVRAKYEEIAKKEKQKNNILDTKYTSTGIPLSEIERQQKEIRDAEELERSQIRNLVKLKAINQSILDEDIYLIDVNVFCKHQRFHLIAECTVLRFNLREGIKDHYHEQINPGKIPLGYAHDVKLSCEEYGLVMPDETENVSNYIQILANIIDYLKLKDQTMKTMPPLFTIPDKVQPVQDFIMQMCSRAAEDDSLFRVYKLDYLFFTLINAIKVRSDEGLPKESLAMLQLSKDLFKYNPNLGCEHHEETDKSFECTTSRTKRWAFTILDSCCPIVGIDIVPGKHVPYDYDLDGILTYKEQKKDRLAPTVASSGKIDQSLDDTLSASGTADSLCRSEKSFKLTAPASSLNTTSSGDTVPKKEKRTHAPLRKPDTNYSTQLRPAPELSESNFPALSTGLGRGRGLSGSLNKMKRNK